MCNMIDLLLHICCCLLKLYVQFCEYRRGSVCVHVCVRACVCVCVCVCVRLDKN